MKNPLVSVIMPVYNGEFFIGIAIESILNQSFTNFEFLIINDGSTDNSLSIINSFQDDRIIVINQSNKGLAASLNVGISKSIGKYIARMDADDISAPDRFKIQVDFFENNHSISVLSGAVNYIDANGKMLGRSFPITCSYLVKKGLTHLGGVVNHPAVMMRKKDLDNVGKYSEIINKRYEDYHLWMQFLKKGYKINNTSKILLSYRLLDTSITSQYQLTPEAFKLLKRVIAEDNIKADTIDQINQYYIEQKYENNESPRSLHYKNLQNIVHLKTKFINENWTASIISIINNIYLSIKLLLVKD